MRSSAAHVLTLAAMLSLAGPAPAADLFVSPSGSDANPGTAAKPFATPVHAVAAVRSLIAAGLKEDVRVTFAAGTYELEEPLVFTPADSGTAAHSITYAAAPGQTAVLSGGRRITGWKRTGEGKWTAELPHSKAGKWFFRQLIVNDRRAVRARWPEEDGMLHVATVTDGVKTFTFDRPLHSRPPISPGEMPALPLRLDVPALLLGQFDHAEHLASAMGDIQADGRAGLEPAQEPVDAPHLGSFARRLYHHLLPRLISFPRGERVSGRFPITRAEDPSSGRRHEWRLLGGTR
jgi:hypothetical protein